MKNYYSTTIKSYFLTMILFVFSLGYSQTEKQVQEIIKDYDMVKANQLLKSVKQREELDKKLALDYAKKNNLPIFSDNPKGGFDQLMRISPEGIPIYYSIHNAAAATSTRVDFLRTGGGLGLNLTGTGMVPRMWDGGPIHAHREYTGKINMVDGTVRDANSFHAIHVMGTIIGTGVDATAKGMAPAATSRSFDWNEDESEAISEAMNGMLVSNHSYGTPIRNDQNTATTTDDVILPPWYMGSYVGESYNWDVIAYTFPNYLPIMSAGNDGTENGNTTPTTTGYDKLNGNKNAKNILTIANSNDATVNATTGAITAGGAINTSSSQGPSDDRRIKPDVAGNGTSLRSAGSGSGTGGLISAYSSLTGTSMAAPNVTGTLTLIQQHANNVNGKFLKAATLKGITCHTATDMDAVGPDAKSGWGYVNAKFAAETITYNGLTSWVSEEQLSQGQSVVKQFVATGGTTPLLASICWTDVPDATKINTTSTVNESTPDLTNDLDVRITQGASTFYPWRLASAQTSLASRTGDNNVDNVERINVDAPTANAVYTVTITHKGTLADGPQKFALVVTGVKSDFTFKTLTDTQTKCSGTTDSVYPFTLTKNAGANINFTSANLPAGATLAFSANNFAASGSFNITISNLAAVASGSYVIDVIGSNGTESEIRKIFLTVYHPTFSAPVYTSPADGLLGMTTGTTLAWQNDTNATSWDVEVSTTPTFSTLAFSGNVTTPTFNVAGLTSKTIYYWRVRPKNSCATPAYSGMRSFQTAIIDCTSAAVNGTIVDGTLELTAGGAGSATVNITSGQTIGKITASVNISHTYVQDMTITLTGPAAIGSPVVILQQESCGGQPNINCTYDDAGVAPACSATSPAISGNIISFEALSNFDGLAANGVWTLNVNDPYNGDGGTLNSFSLKICGKSAITPVPVLTNNTINVLATSTTNITSSDINVTTTAQTSLVQTYTLLQVPTSGNLKKNGTNMIVGNTFTQKDVNDGIISFTNTESTSITSTFKVDVKNSNDGWVPSRTVTINIIACGSQTSTWNGSAWSNGTPTKFTAVTFAGNYSTTSDLEACSITVNTGVNVTVNAGHTFVINGAVVVNGTGVFTVNNNAALKQISSIANTGNIVVKRNSTAMTRLNYTAWSSPVANQQLQSFSPNTLSTRFYQYVSTGTTTPTAYQSVLATSNFVTGKGYMVRSANDWPTSATVFNGQFVGVPTNGDVPQTLGLGFNLLGNPYPSPISANSFLSANTSVNTLYFWSNAASQQSGTYVAKSNYSSYNILGGTASVAGGAISNGTIQTGQGFFVNATAASSVNFTNLQRVNAISSIQFFRNSTEQSADSNTEKHRIWLNLNDESSNYNQILLGYTESATNGFDFAYDGRIPDSTNSTLYSVLNNQDYVIQGKGLPFSENDEIVLGINAKTAGNYSIALESVDGLFTNQNIYIKDNISNILHDIKVSPYQFSTAEGVFNDRFKVVYTNAALANESFISSENVNVITQNQELKISASKEIVSVEVIDVLGKVIFTKTGINNKQFNTNSITANNQALIVKIQLENGEQVIKKIVM